MAINLSFALLSIYKVVTVYYKTDSTDVSNVGVWFRGRNLVNTCTQIKQFLCLNTLKDISLYDEYNMMNIANTIFKALHLLIV